MARKKKLPKGLAEFEGSLGNLEWTPELLKRLLDLPENCFQRDMAAFKDALKVVEGAEVAASNAREYARRIAMRIWDAAKSNWSVKELQEATGYDMED